MSNYRKTMTEALREMYPLNEGTIDKVKEIASKKQAMKIDGVMVDSFTASAISQIYDKVNDTNKKKMDKLPITKLANLAFKMMQKNDYVPEEADLDEGKMKNTTMQANKPRFERKGQELEAYANKFGGVDKKDMMKVAAMLKRGDKSGALKYAKTLDTDPKEYIMSLIGEETELDEAKQVLAHGGKGKYKVVSDGGAIDVMFKGKSVGKGDFDRGADSFFVSIKGEKGQKSFDDAQAIADYFAKNKITEEVDLDEKKTITLFKNKQPTAYDRMRRRMNPKDRKTVDASDKKQIKDLESRGWHRSPYDEEVELDEGFSPKEIKMAIGIASDKRYAGGNMTGAVAAIDKIKKGLSDHPQVAAVLRRQNEEVDLDEGKMSQLHQYIKDKKSAEEIAKLMKVDVKTIKSLMSSHHPEDVEEGAAADARRAMRRDKDFSRRDSADDDTDATDDDIKGASKNIMMQMRKAQSLASGGKFKVEFGDGKKVKIPANMAIAVQQKYNSMRKPADKEKFQARIGKSYKDMLSALKEELQPKKESILERMNRKIKENKDG